MATKVEICNLALGHLGIGKQIVTLDTEQSQEAIACRRFFDVTRDETLRDAAWPFARRRMTLAQIEEDPNDDWAYSYRYPTDCLMIRRIYSGIRTDDRQSRVSYEIASDDAGWLIFTDEDDAKVTYTTRYEDVAHYPPDFVMAMALRLAFNIAPWLTKGDPFGMGNRALQMYVQEISKARASAFNEEQPDENPFSEFTRARE
jgi:hypothetical protein